MLNLRNILQLVNHSLNNSALAQQQSIAQKHQTLFHIAFEFGDNLDTDAIHQFLKQFLGDVTFISKHFAKQMLQQVRYRFSVVHITRSNLNENQSEWSSLHSNIQRFAGSWGTVVIKSLIQKEVENLKCPSYACEPLYSCRDVLDNISFFCDLFLPKIK